MFKKYLGKFIGFALVGLLFATPVKAADFYFENFSSTTPVNQEIKLDIAVEATSVNLNAVAGQIIIPADFFDTRQIITGESGISFWLEEPAQNNDSAVPFSGIVTNGFSGKIRLFSLILSPKKTGEAIITTRGITALINDGKGTSDQVKSPEARIVITGPVAKPSEVNLADVTAPEFDTIELANNRSLCQGKSALIFHAVDKETGVSKYDVREQKTYSLFGLNLKIGSWTRAQSPYCLSDNHNKSDIEVRASDQAGNSVISRIVHSSPIYWYENILLWGIILSLALFSIAIFFIYVKRRDKK